MLCFTIVYKREQMKYKSEANCVEKKDFAKGFLSGVLVVVLLVTAVKSFSVVQGIFSTNMSAETKITTIQKYIDKYYASTGAARKARSSTSVIRAWTVCSSWGRSPFGSVAKHTVTTAQAMTAATMTQNAGFL